jgi:hypothetical protein
LSSTTNFSVNGFQVGYTQSSSNTSVDPIIGLNDPRNSRYSYGLAVGEFMGRIRIAESDYFIPFYADVGGGGGTTQLTSQAFLGAGRAFDWGEALE